MKDGPLPSPAVLRIVSVCEENPDRKTKKNIMLGEFSASFPDYTIFICKFKTDECFLPTQKFKNCKSPSPPPLFAIIENFLGPSPPLQKGGGHCVNLTNPILITAFYLFRPEGHQKSRSEVGSLSPAECLVGFETGTF